MSDLKRLFDEGPAGYCCLNDLDDACLLHILRHLTPLPDLFRVARTCWRLYRLACDKRMWLLVSPRPLLPNSTPSGRGGYVYPTLKEAVSRSRPGDTIWLAPQVDHPVDDIKVPWPLHLVGGGLRPEDTCLVAPRGADAALEFCVTGKVTNIAIQSTLGACIHHRGGHLVVDRCLLQCDAAGLTHLCSPLVTSAREATPGQRRTLWDRKLWRSHHEGESCAPSASRCEEVTSLRTRTSRGALGVAEPWPQSTSSTSTLFNEGHPMLLYHPAKRLREGDHEGMLPGEKKGPTHQLFLPDTLNNDEKQSQPEPGAQHVGVKYLATDNASVREPPTILSALWPPMEQKRGVSTPGRLTVVETRFLGRSLAVRCCGTGSLQAVRVIYQPHSALFWFHVDSAQPGQQQNCYSYDNIPDDDVGVGPSLAHPGVMTTKKLKLSQSVTEGLLKLTHHWLPGINKDLQ